MTESEWQSCIAPEAMLEFLRDTASKRKLRLFACACCRSIWHLLTETEGRVAVEVSERYADRLVTARELTKVRRAAENAWLAINSAQADAYKLSRDAGEAGCILLTAVEAAKDATCQDSAMGALSANICAAHSAGYRAATLGAPVTYDEPDAYVRAELAGRQNQYVCHNQLLNDIFGNPFRPTDLDAARLSPAIVKEGQSIYDSRAFDRLLVLAAALELAGCENQEILSHLRSPGPHVRGCWALDLILGKK